MKKLLMAACIASLAACGADSEEREVAQKHEQEWEQLRASLIYSYPADQQVEVPTQSPVVLRFSSAVTDTSPDIVVREVGGADMMVNIEWTADNQSAIVDIQGDLDPRTEYEVVVPDIALQVGTAQSRIIGFTTRALEDGPTDHVAAETFEVVRTIPDGSNFPVVDFATFRVQFSQPIDSSSASYGDNVALTGPDGLVDAHVLVEGHYLTVDPKNDLTPGATYTLTVSETFESELGVTLGAGEALSMAVTPRNTRSPSGERSMLIHDVAGGGVMSPLTGSIVNMIPMASVLLGEETATQSSGLFGAELAYAPNFPEVTPLRISRGTLLEGASIDVLIGGEVDAGFDSGEVGITFLSDATGYMVPNPYSNADDAPRNIHLFMDVAVATGDSQANGAINQNLLHIELVGTAIVEDGALTVNAVGMAEPEVLGSEPAESLLSFYMKAFDHQDSPPLEEDTTSPQLVTWTPGDNVGSFGVDDSILFVFDEPVTLADASTVTLSENGVPIDAEVKVDGATLVLKPAATLKDSRESTETMGEVDSYSYEVSLGAGITDVAGNPVSNLAGPYQFELPTLVELLHWTGLNETRTAFANEVREVEDRAPAVLAVYPGYPCVYDTTKQDLIKGILGRCLSGLAEAYESPARYTLDDRPPRADIPPTLREADDLVYMPELPTNRPITVVFSKPIDPQSVVIGTTFSVESVGELSDEPVVEPVDGRVSIEGNVVTFWPATPWDAGAMYRYTLASTGDLTATVPVNCGTDAICDTEGLPIQTQVVQAEFVMTENGSEGLSSVPVEPEAGGPDMVQYFTGMADTESVLQVLNAPSLDRNANYFAERNLEIVLIPKDSNGNPAMDTVARTYDLEELGTQSYEPITGACSVAGEDCLDPDGVHPLPNTTKLLSAEYTRLNGRDWGLALGLNTGCSYEGDWETPLVCPENKIMYLTSGLVAEVDGFDTTEGAVSVSIWPGQVMVSSVRVFVTTSAFTLGLDSGPQRIRMRFAQDDPQCVPAPGAPCVRNKPIQGWIRNDGQGPVLEATVDGYVDALALEQYMDLRPIVVSPWHHEIISVPVTLNLSGSVEFLDDGRMVVNQLNTNEIRVEGYGWAEDFNENEFDPWLIGAKFDFVIPANGTHMQYISAPIK